MTRVRLGLASPAPDGQPRLAIGALQWKPSRRRVVGDNVMLPDAFTVALDGTTAPVVELAPTGAEWAWTALERVRGGSPSTRFVVVPDTTEVLDYAALAEVDPATLEPTATPEAAWSLRVDAVEDRVDLLETSGGVTPEQIEAAVETYIAANTDEVLAPHVNDPTPHPAYDDLPSLTLLFENGLV